LKTADIKEVILTAAVQDVEVALEGLEQVAEETRLQAAAAARAMPLGLLVCPTPKLIKDTFANIIPILRCNSERSECGAAKRE